MKAQKGITLVALIITIVVLLILAVVAITAITNDNIINYANNAAQGYETEKELEKEELGRYEDVLSQYSNQLAGGVTGGGEDDIPEGELKVKGLNTNKADFATVLAVTRENNGNLFYDNSLGMLKGSIITYTSGSSKLVVKVMHGTTFQDYSIIDVTYTDKNGNSSTYAIYNPEDPWTLEEHSSSYGGYPYIQDLGEWSKPSGTYSDPSGNEHDVYRKLNADEFPEFKGAWVIDEANTTDLGKQYLSKVLVDIEE